MDFNHFQQHLSRCTIWASTYSMTGSYKPIDLKKLKNCKPDLGQSSNSSDSPCTPPIKRARPDLNSLILPNNINNNLSNEVSHGSSHSSSQEGSESSFGSNFGVNQSYVARHRLVMELRKDIQNFHSRMHEEYNDVLEENEIEKEFANQFCNKKALLKKGFINIQNILDFAQKRPIAERRLLKIATLPDAPSMEELTIYAKHFRTTNENILLWSEQRLQNDPKYFRSDKYQKRISIKKQTELMTFIYENCHFLPKKDGIKKEEVGKIKNLATRIFLR